MRSTRGPWSPDRIPAGRLIRDAAGHAILGVVSDLLPILLVSLVAGGFGSLVGIGGGLILVPVLTTLMGYDIKIAIAASLVGVIATSVSASPRFLQSGLADRRLGVFLLVATAAGGLVGGVTANYVDGRVLAIAFGTLLVLVSIQMARGLRRAAPVRAPEPSDADGQGLVSSYLEPTTGERVSYRARRLGPGAAVSFVAGNISGLLGVGGGVINVPTMNVLMNVPLRVATTTSTYMLGATAAASAMVNAASGRLDPLIAAPVALGVLVGSRLGAHLSYRVSQRTLRMVFVGVALFFAAQMFGRVLWP